MICLPPIHKVFQHFNKMANQCVVCLADFPNEWDICNSFRCCSAKWCNDCEKHIHKCPQCRSENNTTYGQLKYYYAEAKANLRILNKAIQLQQRTIQSLLSLQTRKTRLKFDGMKLTYA